MKTLTWGICLVIFCLPLYLVRFELFNIPITVLEVLIYILFVLWLVKGFKFGEFKKLLITHHSLLIATLLILIGVTLATIFSSDLRTSAGIWKAWFVGPLLFFIVVISVIKTSEQIKKVLYSLFSSGTVVAIISLIYLIQGKLDPVGRLQSFYNSPNYLAMYLVPALIIGAGYYLFTFLASPSEARSGIRPRSFAEGKNHARFGLITRKKIIPSTFIFFSVVCLLLSIFFSKSFGAWIGIVAAIAFFLSLKAGLKHKFIILGLALIIILALGHFALVQKPASFEARLIIWEKTVSIYKNNSILGIGPGTFESYAGVPQPHNIFLAFLLQTGIIGFIGFIWLLVYFFRIGFTKLRITDYGLLVTCLMSIMVYILVHGLLDTTYWKNDLAVLFWMIVGLMLVFRHLGIRNFIRN